MKQRPILFKDDMIRAILEGRKTQTRRVLDIPAGWSPDSVNGESFILGKITSPHPKRGRFGAFIRKEVHPGSGVFQSDIVACRYGQPGDRLWVRETTKEDVPGSVSLAIYDADYAHVMDKSGGHAEWWYSKPVCPSIHMPRWASRITLEITGVRVERLQDISAEDARAEGCEKPDLPPEVRGVAGDFVADERTTFAILWNRINGPDSWNANPWVWVIEFRRIKP